jgi:hydroxyacyl-ACP dehydratase HTD2-like protein with hotdog domain
LLRVGDQVEERTKLLSAVPKKSKSTSEMVLVEVEREFWGPQGLALVDKRSWVFRPEVAVNINSVAANPEPLQINEQLPTQIKDIAETGTGKHVSKPIQTLSAAAYIWATATPVRQLRWSPVGLFRFSALTFNGHKIHYNSDWTRTVEGHPGVVVHGPLNLINMLDYWRDIHGDKSLISDITYRAMAPIYAGEEYNIRTADVEDMSGQQRYTILVEKQGTLCMKAEIGATKQE